MSSITVRNIPDDILEKIRILSNLERRSINSEILNLLESGISYKESATSENNLMISRDTQLTVWNKLAGNWKDKKSTKEIIDNIYRDRTYGRDFEL